MTMYVSMWESRVFTFYMPCSWFEWVSPRPRNFPGVYLSYLGGVLLTPKLVQDNLYISDAIWSPSAFDKLVSVRV